MVNYYEDKYYKTWAEAQKAAKPSFDFMHKYYESPRQAAGYIGPLTPKVPTPLEQQEGGTHYKNFKIQPVEYNHANNIPFLEGNIIKYVTRWRQKDGIKDLKKARHCIDILLELENGNNISRP